jgi:hypothetical protein
VIVVLLIVAVLWMVVLGPGLVRRWVERRSTDSIGSFHRQLGILQRTRPSPGGAGHLTLPAEGSVPEPASAMAIAGPGIVTGRRSRHGARGSAEAAANDNVIGHSRRAAPGVGSQGRRRDPFFRPEACQRRRTVYLAILGLVLTTGVLGALPGVMHELLIVTALGLIALAAYTVLLVRARMLAKERQMKLRYLPEPRGQRRRAVVEHAEEPERRVAAR